MNEAMQQMWAEFVDDLVKKRNSGSDLLQSCWEFRCKLSNYLRLMRSAGSSEDLANLFSALEESIALPPPLPE